MSNLSQIASVVGAELGDVEKAHLTQVSDGIALVSSLLAAGRSLGIPFSTQQRVLGPALQAIGKLAEVGQGYADAHAQLSAYVRKQGLDPSAFGESGPGPSAMTVQPDLRVVA